LTKLQILDLDKNKISDLAPLAILKKLKYLDIRNNPITDYSSLEELEKNECKINK
jgi:Leucine-rich repeat (LRR) protein